LVPVPVPNILKIPVLESVLFGLVQVPDTCSKNKLVRRENNSLALTSKISQKYLIKLISELLVYN